MFHNFNKPDELKQAYINACKKVHPHFGGNRKSFHIMKNKFINRIDELLINETDMNNKYSLAFILLVFAKLRSTERYLLYKLCTSKKSYFDNLLYLYKIHFSDSKGYKKQVFKILSRAFERTSNTNQNI